MAGPAGKTRLVSPELIVRFVLAALAVLLCYQFQWEWLRRLTCDWNLRLDALAGVHLQRIAFDKVIYRGEIYRYAIACTMVDAFCGALPLIWSHRESIARNLAIVVAAAVALF